MINTAQIKRLEYLIENTNFSLATQPTKKIVRAGSPLVGGVQTRRITEKDRILKLYASYYPIIMKFIEMLSGQTDNDNFVQHAKAHTQVMWAFYHIYNGLAKETPNVSKYKQMFFDIAESFKRSATLLANIA